MRVGADPQGPRPPAARPGYQSTFTPTLALTSLLLRASPPRFQILPSSPYRLVLRLSCQQAPTASSPLLPPVRVAMSAKPAGPMKRATSVPPPP